MFLFMRQAAETYRSQSWLQNALYVNPDAILYATRALLCYRLERRQDSDFRKFQMDHTYRVLAMTISNWIVG